MQRTAIVFILTLLFSFSLQAQEIPPFDYSDPRSYEIAAVEVEGVKYLSHSAIIQLSGLAEGQTISVPGDKITKATRKLWDNGLFSDVEIFATKVDGNKIWLKIRLVGQPRIAKLELQGVRRSYYETLLEKIPAKAGMQLTDNLRNKTRYIIREHYYEKGFYNADIEFIEKPDSSLVNASRLIIKVDRNDKVRIEEIKFSGNQVFSENKLQRKMKETKERSFFRFWKPSKFRPELYEEDKEALINAYRKEGYRDATIVSDTVYKTEPDRLAIDIEIDEGGQYYFGDIDWVGNTKYDKEELQRALKIKKGDVYNEILLNERLSVAEDALANLYLDNGYLFYQCNPVEIDIHEDTVELEMRIYEGKQADLREITISGNEKTNEHVIRRELRTRPGQLFSRSDIVRSVRELAQLGFFDPENIVPTPEPDPQTGTVDLNYAVQERSNDQIEVSGGWGAGMIIGSIGLRLTNLSLRNFFNKEAWNPIPTGDGETLSLRARSNGRRYQSYSLSLTEPWVGGKRPNSLSFSLYHTLQTNGLPIDNPRRTSIQISGASVSLGRRLRWPDDYFSLSHSISYQHYVLNDWGYFLFENGLSNNLSFSTRFARNSVDNPLYARRGSKVELGLQITPPYSMFNDKDYAKLHEEGDTKNIYDWIEYHKWTFSYDGYSRLWKDLVFRTKAEFGYLGHFNDQLGPSPFEGFNLGGDGMTGYNFYGRDYIALRGYENNSLTPEEGGNVYNKFTMELRYPVTLKPSATIYALTFLEAGNAWQSIKAFNPYNINRSAGVGVRIYLPMLGLMGIDWGYGFDPIPGRSEESWGSQFHFVLGQQF